MVREDQTRGRRRPGVWAILAAVFLAVLMAGCSGQATPTPTAVPPSPTSAATATSVPARTPTPVPTPTPSPTATPLPSLTATPAPPVAIIGGHVFTLEVADAPEERSRGLMDRTRLARNAAMLFVFEGDGVWAFWMKNTLIPLDAVWIDAQGLIVDIQTMVPEPGTPDTKLKVYRPRGPARYVLEMHAGLAQEYGFAPGMAVEFRLGPSP